jgi:hypothetical protein
MLMQIYNDLILSALVCCSHNLFFCFNNSSSSSSVKKSVFESKPIRLYSVIEGMLSLETEVVYPSFRSSGVDTMWTWFKVLLNLRSRL